MKKILFIEFHNLSPHIETSFELAKRHLDTGDHVMFRFLGHGLPFREHSYLSRFEAKVFRRWLPEQRAARLIKHPNLDFVGDVKLTDLPGDLRTPRTLNELKEFTYRGADIGMGVASSLISLTRNSHFDPSQHQDQVRNALAGSIAAYEYSHDLIATSRPDIVYIFNGRLCHPRAALRAAEHLGVRTRVHDRGADMTRFVVRDFTPHNRMRIQEDVLSTWAAVAHSPTSVETAQRWFEERRGGNPKDWHSFTSAQQRDLLPELDSGARVVTYFSSSDDELAAIGEEFRWKGWRDQLDAVKNLVEVMRDVENSQLVIRIHPHLTQKHPDDLAKWLEVGKADSSVIVVEPESPIDSYALLDASDVVVTGGSTIGLEAVYWGKPSILLGPSEYDELGAVQRAISPDRLRELLNDRQLGSSRESSLPYAYYRATFGELFHYFEPTGLFGGRFIGEDLHRLPRIPRAINRTKEFLLGKIRSVGLSLSVLRY